jgi:hypothetical protein
MRVLRCGPVMNPRVAVESSHSFPRGAECYLLHPSIVRPEMNSEGDGNRVCFTHGISWHKRAVLPSLPRHDTAEHATQPIGLLPHL